MNGRCTDRLLRDTPAVRILRILCSTWKLRENWCHMSKSKFKTWQRSNSIQKPMVKPTKSVHTQATSNDNDVPKVVNDPLRRSISLVIRYVFERFIITKIKLLDPSGVERLYGWDSLTVSICINWLLFLLTSLPIIITINILCMLQRCFGGWWLKIPSR